MHRKLHSLLQVFLVINVIGYTSACKKKETSPVPATAVIDGKWKYQSNIGGGCTILLGTLWDIKNGEATTTYVPSGSGFQVGEKMLTNITQSTSPNNYTAIGYSRNTGGAVVNSNIKVNLSVATAAQSMTVLYTNVCNPVQVWVRSN